MSKFTPGKWLIADGTFVYALDADRGVNRFDCNVQRGYTKDGITKREELEANARLIAAAPELLGLLKEFPMLLAPASTAWGKQVQEWQDKVLAKIDELKVDTNG